MGIIDVKEDFSHLGADIDESSAKTKRVFTVQFDEDDTPASRPILAYKAADIPKIRKSRHPADAWLYVKSKNVRVKGDSLTLFEVTVNYGTTRRTATTEGETPAPADYEVAISPLEASPRIRWTTVNSNEQIDRDANGEPLTNSAKESFDPPISREVDDLVLSFVRNEESFDQVVAASFKNAVNADEFLGFEPGTVKCTRFDGEEAQAADQKYFVVSYEFQIRYDGWKRRILDQGFREDTGSTDDDGNTIYEIIKDTDGNPVREPVLLDGEGKILAEGEDAVFLEKQIYPELDFSNLNISV